jgi:hypothetical protein
MVRTEPTLVDVVVRVEVKGKVHFSNSGEPEKKRRETARHVGSVAMVTFPFFLFFTTVSLIPTVGTCV